MKFCANLDSMLGNKEPTKTTPKQPFGYYWQLVHPPTGQVVNDGFERVSDSKDIPKECLQKDGWQFVVVILYES